MIGVMIGLAIPLWYIVFILRDIRDILRDDIVYDDDDGYCGDRKPNVYAGIDRENIGAYGAKIYGSDK